VKVKLFLLAALAALSVTGIAVASESVVIRGTSGNDVLTGSPGDDRIFARAGDDQIAALEGNDRVFGSWGADSIDLGSGNDFARGGPGPDKIDGALGNDIIHGGRGADQLQGGEADDRLFMLARDHQADVADCGPGNDKVWVNVKENKDTYVNCETVFKVRVTRIQSEDDDS
jgi:Ca2+-binding RTX toxin-like protein